MIEGIFLPFYSSIGGGGVIGDILFQWEQAGVFNYVLPFLLIFALVFGVLSKINLFGNNKGVSIVIALATSLLALQFNFVSIFFAEIFPRMGIALSIILTLLILAGLFIDPNNRGTMNFITGAVLIITAVVIITSLDAFSGYAGYGIGSWLGYNWVTILGILVFLGLIIAVVANPRTPGGGAPAANNSLLARALLGTGR